MEIALIFMCLAIVLLGLSVIRLIKYVNALGSYLKSEIELIEDHTNSIGCRVTAIAKWCEIDNQEERMMLRECNQVGLLCPYEENGYCPFDSCRWED